MVQLGPQTLDRAAEIITAYLVAQQRRAMQADPDGIYVDLDDLREYAEKCAEGYRKSLSNCKDIVDLDVLRVATAELLNVNSDEYLKAFKPKKGKRK